MKKYKVTEKHGFLKNSILTFNKKEISAFNSNRGLSYFIVPKNYEKDKYINSWLNGEWIEEIEEKEFTKSDLIDFVTYYDQNYVISVDRPVKWSELFNKWLKQRK